MKRGGPPRRRTPLRSMSLRRRNEKQERHRVIGIVGARDGWRCKASGLVPGQCWGPLEADEYDQRGVRPGGHLDPDNVQLLCHAHHQWKTDNAVEAARLGLRPFPRGYLGDDGHADRDMPQS